MKTFREQNYYELLDVPPEASPDQISRAYAIAKRQFANGSLASYSLFDSEERRELLARIDEAWHTLSDRERRLHYDQDVLGREPSITENASGPKTSPESSMPPLVASEVTGAALRTRREAVGIPLQEIARNTRISIAYLQFIEEDHVRGLPHDAYLRAYLAQYARAIRLDPQIVSDGYLRHLKALRGQ